VRSFREGPFRRLHREPEDTDWGSGRGIHCVLRDSAAFGLTEIVQDFLHGSVDINAKRGGLLEAIRTRCEDLVRIFLQSGANTEGDLEGGGVLDYAIQ